MRMMKGIFFFLVAFVAASIVILTFMQPPFQVLAGAKVLWYQTPVIPVYWYLIAAFAIGLLFGFVVFIYYYTQQGLAKREVESELSKADRENASLKELLREANTEIETLQRRPADQVAGTTDK